jgi:hypothetical protein
LLDDAVVRYNTPNVRIRFRHPNILREVARSETAR